ncbi:MAG TPA: PadR family transcriptional regulator [Lachnospiraceae bacterium]|nr:PadR family transcriptional regulator [Lachnospiraceae bacterium]
MLKHGILGLLNYHDMTGYEIMTVFRDSLRFFWSAQTSQIYRELQGLEKKNWVDKTYVPQQGKPDKNVYTITEAGKEELIQWLADDNLGLQTKSPLLMKTFFMGERSREENIRYFYSLIKYCEIFLKSLDPIPEYIEAYANYLPDKGKALYWEMTVDYGRRNMRMLIEWAQSCMERLENNRE